MSSFRNYSNVGSYRPSNLGSINYGRTPSTGSGLSNYRSSYASFGSPVGRISTKDRNIAGVVGTSYGKGDKVGEKSSYKFLSGKNLTKDKQNSRSETTDDSSKSPLSSSKSSLADKYPSSKSIDRPSSVFDRYSRDSSRDGSRETDTPKYSLGTYPATKSYGENKAEKASDCSASQKNYRTNSARCSREPSADNSSRSYKSTPANNSLNKNTNVTNGVPKCSVPVLTNKEETNTGFIKPGRFSTQDKLAKDEGEKKESTVGSKLSEDEGVSSKSESTESEDVEVVIVTVATRGTSPTAPSNTAFLRARRNDAVKVVERDIARARKRPEVKNAETQSERDDSSRYMSYRSSRTGAPWVSYLDKYSSYPSTRTYGNSTSRIGNYLYSRSENANSHSTKCENLKSSDQDSQQKTEPRFKRDKTPSQTDISHLNQVPKSTEPKENGVKVEEKEATFEKKPLVRSARTSPRSSPVTKSDKSDSSRSSSRTESTKSDSRKDSQSDSKSRSSAGKVPSRQLSRADSTESSVSGPAAKSRTSSASSTSSSAKIKTPPSPAKSPVTSVNAKSVSSVEARGKPPVPKPGEMANKSITNGGAKYVNKDFRKSALNMENGDPSRSQMERKKLKKRSSSSSSAPDSEDSKSSAVTSSRLSGRSKSSVSTGIQKFSPKKSSLKSESSTETLTRSKSDSSGKKRVSASNTDDSESDESSSDDGQCKAGSEGSAQRPRGTPESSLGDRGKMSAASSRTSVLLASSADELCLTDKPPLPKSRVEGQTEEAKSFLVRALAPVTQFFRAQTDESDKTDDWLDDEHDRSALVATQNLTQNFNLTSPEPEHKSYYSLNRQFSEDKPWWLDPNSDNIPEGVEVGSGCNDDISQDTTISTILPDDGKCKLKVWRQDSEEKSCWLDVNDNIPEDEANKGVSSPGRISRKGSSRSSTKSAKKNRIRHQQSGERAWWMSDDPDNVPEGIEVIPVNISNTNPNEKSDKSEDSDSRKRFIHRIRHIDSGERPWWMDSSADVPEGVTKLCDDSSSSEDSSESFERLDIGIDGNANFARFPLEFPPPPTNEPLGDRASPEGVENPPDPPENYERIQSPYDNNVASSSSRSSSRKTPRKRPSNLALFISKHTDIDDLLGDTMTLSQSPVMSRVHKHRREESLAESSSECEEIDATQVIIHDSTPKTPVIQRRHRDVDRPQPDGYIPLDDTALQLYKDGDYGAYLDLEASISEQQEEFEGFQINRKNSIVLRTQLSVRVHTIIEKLLNSEGRELRRALFSLKQIFQEDKDLVHEFVQNDGLACLIKVGSEADQNYQNYILRALGQVMLYVDGMNGVMEHGQTVQWLYTLIASRFRLVVKTALKLLLVFVEYVETNSLLLVRAIRSVDTSRGMIPWTNVMKLLIDYDAADTELLIFAMTLVNKCLNGISDQDTYYDQVDCLEEQGIEGIIQRYMSKQGTDLDLLRQFQIYEAVLHHEDGNDKGSPIRQLDDNIRKTLRNRKSLMDSCERRKSRRHSTGTTPLSMTLNSRLSPRLNHSLGLNSLNNTLNSSIPDDDDESSSSQSSQGLGEVQLNGNYKENNKVDVGVTPALKRRRERAERQRSFIREQQEATVANMRASIGHPDDQESKFGTNGLRYTNGSSHERNADLSNKLSRANSRKDLTPLMNAANKLDSEEKKPWYGKSPDEGVECDEGNHTDEDEDRRVVLQLKREGTVKDLTQKLAAQNLIPSSPVEEKVSRIGDMSGLISKAKEGLAKSKSKADLLKSPTEDGIPKFSEIKKSENELHWEELVKKLKRPLYLCDLDFRDLNSDDEIDVLSPVKAANGIPPPPPPPVPNGLKIQSSPVPPPFNVSLKCTRPFMNSANPEPPSLTNCTPKSPPPNVPKKSKKTVKLFWKEVRDDPKIIARLDNNKMLWDELSPVPVDTQKLEHLFESRAKDHMTKKQAEMNKNKEIIVLDHKRSHAINIGMTKLPPPRSIKTAILKMDATIMNREGIGKLLNMLPTEEERSKIQEAQAANPDLPLGSAEQFLLTLASISELPARLKLWAFKLDFENSEKEIADPLMDLKQGMETLRVNKTFRGILSTLLSIGIFLNGNEVKGFQLEYLAKVPEVKDTVHKHSLLHHLCHMVMEKFPDATDLYSEIGAVTRASRIDFDELASNISKLENECKASWDHLKLIAKHDGSTMMKVKMSDFLADCAERIIVLGIVHRRIINRFRKFILWLGVPLHRLQDTKPNEFCRVVSEFALEYRTTRERVIQQLEKKANHRERNKTRGKKITEVGKFRTKEDRADAELRQLLGNDISDVESIHGTLPLRRQRKDGRALLGPLRRDDQTNGTLTDVDDDFFESLVKTATDNPPTRTAPRERKRTRHADRKSLRRTLKNGLSEEEKKHIAAYIKGY